ncbi:DUF998 domain-containing protein [Streptomyces glomeratus]|uniref:DUF998 domain-containing protein n=1 Tax=Streptomyces glomeratus TaxID=284452 RepID=A0ABP6LNG8_9ACTN|nr:DUF998 domain-containing protein [Streptomyces glomeratus]MCF1511962.1 DUF998 domain-containing protein [Streptomyces glomeratus]
MLAATLLSVAAVTYNDWLLQFLLPTGLDQRDSYVSEVFAADQPYRVLFSGVELATALLVAAGACLAVAGTPRGWAAVGWGALAAFGSSSVADVLLPMRCAPSLETGCPTDNVWHTLTSGAVHFTLFASMAAFAVAARERPGRPQPAGHWAPRLLPVSMAAAICSAGPYVGHPGGQGIAQRIHLVTVAMWFWLLAAQVYRDREHFGSHVPRRPLPEPVERSTGRLRTSGPGCLPAGGTRR